MDIKTLVSAFESINETAEQKLVGGFSFSYGFTSVEEPGSGTTNNCQGGNCTQSCGGGQNIQCNAIAHCGT